MSSIDTFELNENEKAEFIPKRNDSKQKNTAHNYFDDSDTSELSKDYSYRRNHTDRIDRLESYMHADVPYLEEDFMNLVIRRSIVLIILLFIQSTSSFVLDYFENLIKRNYVVILYLTMITGSGGNAGSQTVVFIVKELATGHVHMGNITKVWKRELKIAALLILIVSSAAFLRVFLFEMVKLISGSVYGTSSFTFSNLLLTMRSTFAVIASLAAVVATSIIVGMILPVLFKYIRLDPAHASPVIQVFMDLSGVLITCIVASIILP